MLGGGGGAVLRDEKRKGLDSRRLRRSSFDDSYPVLLDFLVLIVNP